MKGLSCVKRPMPYYCFSRRQYRPTPARIVQSRYGLLNVSSSTSPLPFRQKSVPAGDNDNASVQTVIVTADDASVITALVICLGVHNRYRSGNGGENDEP
jgi:hypothetical protein